MSDNEDLPEDVATPRECQSLSQYQPQSGQYQTVLCEPAVGEPTDASSTVPSDCLPPDVGESAERIAPIEFVIGDANPFVDSTAQEADGSTSRVTCAASPPAGTAPAPAVSSPPGSGGADVEAGGGTAAPASPVSQPVETPTPPIENDKQPAGRPVTRSTTVERGSAQAWIAPARPLRSTPRSVRAKPQDARDKHPASPRTNAETSTPRSRPQALEAPRAERSSSSGPLTVSGSAWLAAAALLLVFALGSFGLAIAGIPVPAKPALLRHLRSRMTSKGLSRHPVDGMDAREQRGIRYRD